MDIILQSGKFHIATDSFFSNIWSIIASLLGAIVSGGVALILYRKGDENTLNKQRAETKKGIVNLNSFLFIILNLYFKL